MKFLPRATFLALTSATAFGLSGRECIVEFKGDYFRPTSHLFKKIYRGGAIYGPEATVELYHHWYGFLSADFFYKRGRSVHLHTPTKVHIVNLGFGVKYLVPFCYGDFYVGLGALPTRLHTHDESPNVIIYRTKWACGGIAKVGAYFDLPHCFTLDIFCNYSFATAGFKNPPNPPTQSYSARLNGWWIGAGVGYRFN